MASMQAGFPSPAPTRIAVLRALKIGDLICAVPAFRAFRAAWPDAVINLIGLPWAHCFARRYRCYLDGFHEFYGYPGLPERAPVLGRIPGFLSAMQEQHFDLVVQLHGSGSFVNPLVALMGGRRSAGFFLPGDYRPDPQTFLPWPNRGREIHRLLRLVEFLGLRTAGDRLEFPITAEDRAAFATLDRSAALSTGNYVCLHAGASVAERRWPIATFAAVGQALAGVGLKIVLTGSSSEAELTSALAQKIGGDVLDLAGQTTLGSLAVVVEGARFVVCNDTAISHVADALGVPSVVLSTGDNPERWAPLDEQRHRVISDNEGVGAGRVIAEVEQLLNSACPKPADDSAYSAGKLQPVLTGSC
jgi:ADP-heptose:LPS heptosyltransferase